MNYPETIAYLFQLQRVGIKYTLDNIQQFMAALDYPHRSWRAIHIAGTNGKGSTAAMLASILKQAGLRVGLYTSPHLIDFTERIRINGQPIPKRVVVEFVQRYRSLIETIQPSFFEVATALAFWYFAREAVDLAVIETGMGGRLDSTNIVHPLLTLITPIDLDHQHYLGHTLEAIAAEKAGIIKPDIPCLTVTQPEAARRVLEQTAQKRGAPFIYLPSISRTTLLQSNLQGNRFHLTLNDWQLNDLWLNLAGPHQIQNALLAVGTIQQLGNIISDPETAIRKGLQSVRWWGRLEQVATSPIVIVDVSHNPAGFRTTLQFLKQQFPQTPLAAIIALQEDKNFQEIGKFVAKTVDKTIVTRFQHPKALKPEVLLQVIRNHGGSATIFPNLSQAIHEIHRNHGIQYVWIIIGSHYLAGEAYKILQMS
ncbi:MAG: bifunctional folylpolyglutamate synthase/dihydrofolate synthase [Calditrichaeota bacterium]|nr:bifunctional folylpolyglutamate synthase/dihydrofolate synthase [Calditrichota bacterium]